jgi:DNA-binding phage protein
MRHLVKELEQIVNRDGRFRYQIEEAAGVNRDTLYRWFHGQPQPNCKGLWGPSLALFDTVLNALGYELVIRRRG